MKKIKVPEAMLNAADARAKFHGAYMTLDYIESILEASLRWLSENPIVPTLQQVREVFGDSNYRYGISENAAQ